MERELLVTGIVSSLPQTGATGTQFRFEVESALADGTPVKNQTAKPECGRDTSKARATSMNVPSPLF